MAKFYGKAESAATQIMDAFKSGDLPAKLAPIFIRRGDTDTPCRRWSWSNQLLTALAGTSDARGYRQWQSVDRHVKKGAKSFLILAPMTRKIEKTNDNGETVEGVAVFGFKAIPVFRLEDTEGEPLPGTEEAEAFLADLPLRDVADHWGLSVQSYNGQVGRALGWYRPKQAIALGVENLSTWCHELIHAADDKRGELTERGQHWRSETVAELGAAILLECLGHETESDRGGCWSYVAKYAEAAKLAPIVACERVLKRTCEAVALILDTAEELAGEAVATTASHHRGSAAKGQRGRGEVLRVNPPTIRPF